MILSFDPSIVKTGFAMKDRYGKRSGLLRAQGKTDVARIRSIVNLVCLMMDKKDEAEITVIIEVPADFTYSRSSKDKKSLNQSSMRKLNFVIGAIIGAAIINGCRIVPITPNEWKGKRKKWVDQLDTGIEDPDEADAMALLNWWLRMGWQIHKEVL